MLKRVAVELHLQTVQRCADNPGRLRLAGQLKGQHILVRLNVAGSALDQVRLAARRKERKKETQACDSQQTCHEGASFMAAWHI